MTLKQISLLALSLTAAPAFAESTPPAPHGWFCTAEGFDFDGRRHSISGRLAPTRELAERDALRTCRGLFGACELDSCFQEY